MTYARSTAGGCRTSIPGRVSTGRSTSFREGNGRLARLLNTLMAFQAGQPALDYGDIRGKKKREYIAAVHAALSGDYEPMEAVFRSVLSRSSQAERP